MKTKPVQQQTTAAPPQSQRATRIPQPGNSRAYPSLSGNPWACPRDDFADSPLFSRVLQGEEEVAPAPRASGTPSWVSDLMDRMSWLLTAVDTLNKRMDALEAKRHGR